MVSMQKDDINRYVFRMINEHINDIQKRTRIVYY